ncbi:MAG TPA: 2OG-Fe(II) oxygenase family protein [Gammaproteobacteria bacterium]|nr:2OG-Fe(II) oxygenase family protein [Gammaproteobacteria bacterium]
MHNPDSVADEPMRFNAGLDVGAAARSFAQCGRVRIDDVLDALSAARLHRCLVEDVPWQLTYNEGEKNVFLDAAALQELGERKQHELLQRVLVRAQSQFQYLFRSYPMVKAYVENSEPGLLLHAVFEWLNDPRTLAVLRKITGIESLLKVNAQATLYRPGHFLSRHDDSGYPEQHRRVAYVLYMTRGWSADWGGQLQFLDAQGEVEEVWMPRFNSLGLFLVPMPHVVGYVAPFATQPRFAITGWLCDGPATPATAVRT